MVKEDTNGNEYADKEAEHMRKLFIGGITPNTTEEMMRDFYGQYGEVVDIVVMRDPTTKRSRGFGFVTYASKAQVDECQKNRPHVIDGKTVDPKRAVPREAKETNVSSKRLYVSGVREDHTDDMFQQYFSQFGSIEKVEIVTDKTTGKPRGFAFINFVDYDSVDQCVLMKSHQINGYRCDVKKGLTKDEMAKAQQSEKDRMDRSGRSRGMGRGAPQGGQGAWSGQGWGGMGGSAGGYGRGGPQKAWDGGYGGGAPAAYGGGAPAGYGGGAPAAYGGAAAGYGGGSVGYGSAGYGGAAPQAWGAGDQWGQQPQQGGWSQGGAQGSYPQGGYGGGGGGGYGRGGARTY